MNGAPLRIGEALAAAISTAARGNSNTSAPAAAILWPDKDAVWQSVISELRQHLPGLCVLGPYQPEQLTGPAIWLKCVIARTLPTGSRDGIPIVYLPSVSRADLRAIESCPRDLRPLAELQYRGVFWSQTNGKDWTLAAFLSSRHGGLGMDMAQDKATQQALAQVLTAGLLLNCSVDEFRSRQINAEWLHTLMAPNPVRDLLVWMNDPDTARTQWSDVLWQVFTHRCQTDYGFDPVADGVLAAAELLARAEGKWAAVFELYQDSYARFPRLLALLSQVQPPYVGLFPDYARLVGYPQINEQNEAALRYQLSACAGMDEHQARQAIQSAEQEHGNRRTWLWSRMGHSPLAMALEHLARLSVLSASTPAGNTPTELAARYQESGWQVDDAALRAMGCVYAKVDVDAITAALRAIYLPWLQEASRRLQVAARQAGGLPPLSDGDSITPTEPGICTVFVDGLRYDVAIRLAARLSKNGPVQLSARWASLPSVTASGKAMCSPVAAWITGTPADLDFTPRVAANCKPLSGHHFRKLLSEQGIQHLGKQETGDPTGRAWVEVGDLDHFGHEHGIRLARDVDTQLSQVMERIGVLCEAGWRNLRIVTDHGWLLIPGGLPASELPRHQTETRWGRCAVLKDTAVDAPLTFGWDWCKEVQVGYAPGVSSFIAGIEYAHGGLSLQESLVPVLEVKVGDAPAPVIQAAIRTVTWKGLRCIVEVESVATGLSVDLRTRPALPATSIVANLKPVEGGAARLTVADDGHIGAAAVVVVLAADGTVLQKAATTVGE